MAFVAGRINSLRCSEQRGVSAGAKTSIGLPASIKNEEPQALLEHDRVCEDEHQVLGEYQDLGTQALVEQGRGLLGANWVGW